jgi:hypothetical protein
MVRPRRSQAVREGVLGGGHNLIALRAPAAHATADGCKPLPVRKPLSLCRTWTTCPHRKKTLVHCQCTEPNSCQPSKSTAVTWRSRARRDTSATAPEEFPSPQILDKWRKPLRKLGDDPFGEKPSDEISKKKLDSHLTEGDIDAAIVVHSAVEDFAQQLPNVIRRFLKSK